MRDVCVCYARCGFRYPCSEEQGRSLTIAMDLRVCLPINQCTPRCLGWGVPRNQEAPAPQFVLAPPLAWAVWYLHIPTGSLHPVSKTNTIERAL